MLREANRDDRSGDRFGKLKADVKVTRQTRKRSAAEALRILFVTGVAILPKTRFTCRAQKPRAALVGSVGQLAKDFGVNSSIGQSLEVIPHAANSRLALD